MRLSELLEQSASPTVKSLSPKQVTAKLLKQIHKNGYDAAQTIEKMVQAGERVPLEVMVALVQDYGAYIRVLPDPPEEVQHLAVTRTPEAIQFIKDPSEAVQLAAVQQDGGVISKIANPTEAVEIAAIAQHPFSIRNIARPSLAAQRAAMAAQPGTFEAINHPAPEICLLAAGSLGAYALELMQQKRVEIEHAHVAAALVVDTDHTLAMFSDLPPDLQAVAFEARPKIIFKLRKLPSFDPVLNDAYKAYTRKADRDLNMPVVGRRRPGRFAGMSPDQMAILRWFDTTGQDRISVRDLKRQPWGNTPYFMNLVREVGGRDITKADVTKKPAAEGASDVRSLLSQSTVNVMPWDGPQRLFQDRQNRSAVYHAPGSTFEKMFFNNAPPEMRTAVDTAKNQMEVARAKAGHPVAPRAGRHDPPKPLFSFSNDDDKPTFKSDARYTIGWVRFTVFGKDIWIDEVQSDLFQTLPEQFASRLKGIQEALMLDFVRRMRRRGAERFYMPTFDMRANQYKNEGDHAPPVSVYRDLPKKMRFKLATVQDVDPLVDGKQAWLLEGVRGRNSV